MAGFVARIALIGLIGIGIVWWCVNLWHEPAYGDTVEYWRLADTLRVDAWRTLAYPVILRLLAGGNDTTAGRIPVYIIQTFITGCAIYYFVSTLDLAAQYKPNHGRRALLLLGIASMPLVLHFSLTILTDSLAASLFLIGLAGVGRVFVLGDAGAGSVGVTAIGIVGSGLVRPERMFPFAALLGVFLILNLLRKRRALGLVALALIVMILMTGILNRETQTADLNRPRLTTSLMLFDRTVQGRATELLPEMPAAVRERMSPDQAASWDKDPNALIWLGNAFDDAEGQAAMREAARVALREQGDRIAAQAAGDAIEYFTAPVNYSRESLLVHSGPTDWTNTRMGGAHKKLTEIYLGFSFMLTFLLIAMVIPRIPNTWKDADVRNVVLLCAAAILLLSMMYAGRTAFDFHIRYALPIYMIEIGVLVWMAVPGDRSSEDPAP
jgi:hypothetical protein